MNAIDSTGYAHKLREIRRRVLAALIERDGALPIAEYARVALAPVVRTQLERRCERAFHGSETS
jgi:hypothetical protein